MRKQYKVKKRSCALCKPHKKGWDNRWKEDEKQEIEIWEKVKKKIMNDRDNQGEESI